MKVMLRLGLVMLIIGLVTGCGGDGDEQTNDSDQSSASFQGKKIVWIDSYHEGYEHSDAVQRGIETVLANTGVELKIIRLDTKRNTSENFAQQAAAQAKAEIDAFKPDVIIASDDNAQKYVIVPHYKDSDIPVVFCGVNWDASAYGYPAANVTGQVEIDLTQQLIELLKPYVSTGQNRVALIGEDTETTRKTAEAYAQHQIADVQPVFVRTYDEFKQAYLDLQGQADMLLFYNNAAIEGWDDVEAQQFILQNTKIPTGSVNGWMNDFVLITLANDASEFGSWAAQTALDVLSGKAVADIPVASNQRGTLYVNLDVAKALDVAIQPNVLRNATIIGGEN
jgi:ABC-type uncharacterized transport system substrate-binding protein